MYWYKQCNDNIDATNDTNDISVENDNNDAIYENIYPVIIENDNCNAW